MGKVELANVEIKPSFLGLAAYVDGRYLGLVTAAQPNEICIHLAPKCLAPERRDIEKA